MNAKEVLNRIIESENERIKKFDELIKQAEESKDYGKAQYLYGYQQAMKYEYSNLVMIRNELEKEARGE